jgi:D-amino-acid dehydrogenase
LIRPSTQSVDVAVVGGGIMGVATAWRAARLGLRVALFEEAELGAGASLRNAGQVRTSEVSPLAAPGAVRDASRLFLQRHAPIRVLGYPTPGLIKWLWQFARATRQPLEPRRQALAALGRLSQELFADFARDHPELINPTSGGALDVYETATGLAGAEAEVKLARAHGFPCDLVDGAAARTLEPMLGNGIAGALYFPKDTHVDPWAFLSALRNEAELAGAELTTGQRVDGVQLVNGHADGLSIGRGRVKARTIVLACGHATPRLTRSLGLRLPLTSGKGYTVDIAGPPELSLPLVFVERHFAATPMTGSVRIAGGMIVGARTATVPRGSTETLEHRAREVLPSLGQRVVARPWAGLRPLTPDGLPVIGRFGRIPNLLVAAGHGMLGVTYSLATAELIAGLCGTDASAAQTRPFSPDRF